MTSYLKETFYYNYTHPIIQDFLGSFNQQQPPKELAIDLYLRVRDGWKYDPYNFHSAKAHFRASAIMERPNGHCLDKSILLIACLRGVGISARLHLAKVRNHIGVERIVKIFGTDELTPHGFVEVWLNGKWVACTPAFNQALCKKLGVDVLDFDGEKDSIFQAYSQNGGKFMEYLEDYGTFEDFPYEFAIQKMEAHYPKFKALNQQFEVFSL